MDTFCHKCVSERSVQQDASVFYLHAGYANVQLTVRPNFLRLRGDAAEGKLSYLRDWLTCRMPPEAVDCWRRSHGRTHGCWCFWSLVLGVEGGAGSVGMTAAVVVRGVTLNAKCETPNSELDERVMRRCCCSQSPEGSLQARNP